MSSYRVAEYVVKTHPNLMDIRSYQDFHNYIVDRKHHIADLIFGGVVSQVTAEVVAGAWELFRESQGA